MKKKYLSYIAVATALVLSAGCGNNVTKQAEQVTNGTKEAANEEVQEEQTKEEQNKEEQNNTTQENDKADNANTQDENVTSDGTDSSQNDTQGENITQNTESESENQDNQQKQPVTQISLDGLSTESIGWGSGGGVNEKNIPNGCTMYQDKYGHLNADFVRTDTEEVFLTFDEGYEYPQANSPTGNTAQILDTLKEKNVKAVFFVTLPYAKENPDLVRRMIDEGHIVGNHSVTHPSAGLPSLGSVQAQQEEIQGVHDYILENFNYEMHLFRFPTGAFSEQSLAILNNMGYKSVFWSFAYRDWYTDDQPDKTEALNNMIEKLHPGAIYLLHGVSSTNVAVLGDFIDAIRNGGYTIGCYQ